MSPTPEHTDVIAESNPAHRKAQRLAKAHRAVAEIARALVADGLTPEDAWDTAVQGASAAQASQHQTGVMAILAGVGLTILTYCFADVSGGVYFVFFGPVVWGLSRVFTAPRLNLTPESRDRFLDEMARRPAPREVVESSATTPSAPSRRTTQEPHLPDLPVDLTMMDNGIVILGVECRHAGVLSMEIRPRRRTVWLGRTWFAEPALTGNADFDNLFVVRTNDEDTARLWLSPGVRRRLIAAWRYCPFRLRDRVASCQAFPNLPSDVEECMSEAVRALARGGHSAERRWEVLADRLGAPLDTAVEYPDFPKLVGSFESIALTAEFVRAPDRNIRRRPRPFLKMTTTEPDHVLGDVSLVRDSLREDLRPHLPDSFGGRRYRPGFSMVTPSRRDVEQPQGQHLELLTEVPAFAAFHVKDGVATTYFTISPLSTGAKDLDSVLRAVAASAKNSLPYRAPANRGV